jgi:hypothetical protein
MTIFNSHLVTASKSFDISIVTIIFLWEENSIFSKWGTD